MANPYTTLGVAPGASADEIKKAYRKLAMKHNPDRNPDKGAEDKFKEAKEAYEILSDGKKRAAYDRFGHAGVSSAAGAGGFDPTVFTGFEDILGGLGDIFGFGDLFGGGRRRGGPQRGADLRYDLEIAFEEAAHGTETTIQIPMPASSSAKPWPSRAAICVPRAFWRESFVCTLGYDSLQMDRVGSARGAPHRRAQVFHRCSARCRGSSLNDPVVGAICRR